MADVVGDIARTAATAFGRSVVRSVSAPGGAAAVGGACLAERVNTQGLATHLGTWPPRTDTGGPDPTARPDEPAARWPCGAGPLPWPWWPGAWPSAR